MYLVTNRLSLARYVCDCAGAVWQCQWGRRKSLKSTILFNIYRYQRTTSPTL